MVVYLCLRLIDNSCVDPRVSTTVVQSLYGVGNGSALTVCVTVHAALSTTTALVTVVQEHSGIL